MARGATESEHVVSGPAEDARPPQAAVRRAEIAGHMVWAAPALTVVGLGLWDISRPEVWRDELATWSAAHRTGGELWGLLHNVDAVSGVYYAGMWAWIRVAGDSPAALRLPSLCAMALAAVFVALTGRRLFGPRAGVAAGLIFAVVPATSRFAQEARGYAFAALGVAAATYALLCALERGGFWRWAGYGACIAVAGAAHLVALTVIAGHACAVAAFPRRERFVRVAAPFAAAALCGAASTIPIMLAGAGQQGRQISWPAPDLSSLLAAQPQLFCSALSAGAVLILSLFTWAGVRWRAVFATCVAAAPIVIVWIVSQFSSAGYFVPRYLLFTLPAWAVAAGGGAAIVGGRKLLAAILVAVTLVGWNDQRELRRPGSHDIYTYPDREPDQAQSLSYSAAAGVIAHGYLPGDALVVDRRNPPWMIDIGLAYYLPHRVRLPDVFVDESAVRLDDFFARECAVASACLGHHPRLWLVSYGTPDDPLTGLDPSEAAAVARHYHVVDVHHVSGLTVTLLERSS